jgi:preprotein translocase subunit SecG
VTIFLTVLHVMVCLVLVVVVLLQHGKGADIGAVFGGGASSTVFGSRGAGNFLTKLTTASALIFMVTSLSLAYLANTTPGGDLFQDQKPTATAPAPGTAPAAPEGSAPAGDGFQEVKPPEPAKPEASAAPEAKAPEAKAPEAKAPEAAPAAPDAKSAPEAPAKP